MNSQAVNQLFADLWQDYLTLTPSAKKIHALLGKNSPIINDHIALRTFKHPKLGLEKLAQHFIALGYVQGGEYHFAAKKLYAQHFEHPDPTQPKVFISELLLDQLSEETQAILNQLIDQVDDHASDTPSFLCSGRHWQLDSHTYQQLLAESEYAAWMSAFGYRVNHFTVSVNHLTGKPTLASVNQQLKQAGFALNTAGGEIKGSAAVLLEQSSTLADKVTVAFQDQSLTIPSCFYEFARRYPQANGELYRGFVAASADKIFESTDQR